MTSKENPWSSHELEERTCEYCGELFIAHHGLQRYCTEKFNRRNYCKNQQKKLLNEKRLAEQVNELAKAGMKVYPDFSLERNKDVLQNIMGSDSQKTVDSNLLDNAGYDIRYFESRTPINGTNKFLIHVADYTLEWIGQDGTVLTFKISRK